MKRVTGLHLRVKNQPLAFCHWLAMTESHPFDTSSRPPSDQVL